MLQVLFSILLLTGEEVGFFHLKARTRLNPLFRLYLPVSVQVGAQVTMTADTATGIITQQRENEHTHGMNLPLGTGIGGTTVTIQPTLITDANRTGVIATHVSSDTFYFTGRLDVAIFSDIK